MKSFFLFFLVIFTINITACDKIASSINQQKQIQTTQTAPNIKDIYIQIPRELSFSMNGHTINTYQNPMPIEYTPTQGNIYYYDKTGNKLDAPTLDGYYRQVLGKDKDGKTVVQDFYQATKTPYNDHFTIKKGGDESLFNRGINDGMISQGANDGFMAWFDVQGNLFATQLHLDGIPIAFLNVMKNGEWIGFIDVHNNKAVRFYPNTTSVLFLYNGRNYSKDSPYMLYYQNGNGMASLTKDNDGNYQIVQIWDENGTPTNNPDLINLIQKDYIPLLTPYATYIQDFITIP